MTSDTADDLALIEDAARGAGHIARQFFGGEFKRWSKEKEGPVTEADLAIDAYLREKLTSARKDYGWLSEETEDDASRLGAEATFIVDPIDGTLAFVRGKPHFTICIAIVRAGRPVASVVYNPVSDELFRAALGEGASCNGARIAPSACTSVEGCRMLGDRAMFEHKAWSVAPNIAWPAMHIESRSSIAYRMVLVARGDFDAMLALSAKHDWDLAAADLIVSEAGARLSTHRGEMLVYNGPTALQPSVVAAGPALHPLLLDRVRHLNLPERRS